MLTEISVGKLDRSHLYL